MRVLGHSKMSISKQDFKIFEKGYFKINFEKKWGTKNKLLIQSKSVQDVYSK